MDGSLNLNRNNLLDRLLLSGSVLLFFAMIILPIIQISVRELNPLLSILGVEIGLSWTVVVSRFLLIIMTYIGMAVAVRNNENIGINILEDWLEDNHPRLLKIQKMIIGILVAGTMLIILRGSLLATLSEWTTQIGGVAIITSGMIYLSIAVGAFLALIFSGMRTLNKMLEVIGYKSRQTDVAEGREKSHE